MIKISDDSLIRPFFMYGMDRSGTTLMSMMIGAHPDIAVPLSATGMWFHFYSILDTKYDGLNTEQGINAIINDINQHERIKLWRVDLDTDWILSQIKPGQYGSVVAAFHQAYAITQNKKYWGNIDIANIDNMDKINAWFPNARYVHIIRDGRDVAISHQTYPYGAGNIAECADAWQQCVGTNLMIGKILGPERYLSFKYENLILKPQETLQEICNFIGVRFDEKMLSYGDTVDDRVPKEKLWLWPELKSPPQVSKIDRWRQEMSENQRVVFEWNAGNLLKELDYEAYDIPPKKFGAYLLELFYFLGRGGRQKRLLGKLGFTNKKRK